MDFSERDWKRLRAVQPIALERYCDRVLDECLAIIQRPKVSAHERYIRLYRRLKDRDRDLSTAFDDMRRSRAGQRLAAMVRLDLLTDEELSSFSPETRTTVLALAELLGSEGARESRK